jgi:prepilin-type processing-associated H-X9-DG protein
MWKVDMEQEILVELIGKVVVLFVDCHVIHGIRVMNYL